MLSNYLIWFQDELEAAICSLLVFFEVAWRTPTTFFMLFIVEVGDAVKQKVHITGQVSFMYVMMYIG